MSADDESLLKSARRKPLFDVAALPVSWQYGTAEIERLIPHRPPMRLIDRLTGFDPAGRIVGERDLNPSDPVFSGHFPEFPVYPGLLAVEMIGQLGLCMHPFLKLQKVAIDGSFRPMALRATRIAGALFLEPLLPGSTVQVLAQILPGEGYLARVLGQVLIGGKVSVVAIGEVMILED